MLLPLVAAVLAAAAPPRLSTPDSAIPACQRGEPAACRRLAERLLTGGSDAVDARYAPALQAACQAKVTDACAGLGMLHLGGNGVPKDAPRAEALLDAACAQGSSVGCARIIERRLRMAPAAERPKLLAQAQERCDALGGSVCFTLAFAHVAAAEAAADGGAAPEDPQADAATRRACDTGSAYACYVRGGELLQAEREQGVARALPLLETACTGDVAPACFTLAGITADGAGGAPKDAARARALYQHACTLGEPQACDVLASTNEGRALGQDPAKAFASDAERLRVSRLYCERGGAEACTTVAFEVGGAAERSGKLEGMEEAVRLLQRGCERGSVRACNVLGHVSKDAVRACNAGSAGQCLVAGFVHAQGTSLPPLNGRSFPRDAAKARAAFEKACAGGQKAACARAKAAAPR